MIVTKLGAGYAMRASFFLHISVTILTNRTAPWVKYNLSLDFITSYKW